MNLLIPIESASDRARYGGKSANLAFLASRRLRVPDGRVVPTDEFTRHVEECGVAGDSSARPLRPELGAELRALVDLLGGRVSVRSSATLEDATTHSFAGQFLTVLDVGVDGVEAAVRAVWASAFSDNVNAYLRRAELDPAKLRMAVVVQRQIDSASSGVAMGKRDGVVVESVFGQGEALVSGALSADQWEIEGGRIARARIASKTSRVSISQGAPTGSLVRCELGEAQRNAPSLSEAQVLEVAAMCTQLAEACEGRAQDCEFAFADGELHLLQTRDVTAALPVTPPPLGKFAPPGKGAWELDVTHFQRPCTPLFQAIFPDNMVRGFKRGTARYGAIISHLDFAFVNGFPYTRLRPVAAPEDATAKAAPPAWLFKLLCKIVPALRQRIKTADHIWATREWRTQLAEWQEVKQKAIAEHLRLQSAPLRSLDDAALAAHFVAVRDHVARMVEQHHTYNIATLLPVGDLLAHVDKWSEGKVSSADAFAVLAGASPISADLKSEDARAVGLALAAHPAAARLLRLDVNDTVISDHAAEEALAKLRALGGDAGDKTNRFLAMREFRLVEGLDPGANCLRECPSLLWQALRAATLAVKKPAGEQSDGEAPARARLRAGIPADKHADLDVLIGEARALVSLRDERALFSDVWAWGILRTTVLEMGRRLVSCSPKLLHAAGELVHATPDEILSLFTRSEGPSAAELESRAAYYAAYTTSDAPATLGPKALPPPSPERVPGAGAARVLDAMLHVLRHTLPKAGEKSADAALRGNAASHGIWEGPAHVVSSHHDAKDIPVGAVLVVGGASSSFTMLAPLASAVISEGGGLLSHVAIVCREYGIPCVCGVPGVLGSLQTGQRVRVDGTRGLVEVLVN